MTPDRKALDRLSGLIAGGDGNDLASAARVVDDLVSSDAGDPQRQAGSLRLLDQQIRSLPLRSRDSFDFASYVLHRIEREIRSLEGPE